MCFTISEGVFADTLPSPAKFWVDRAISFLEKPKFDIQDLTEAQKALDAAGEFRSPGPDELYLKAIIALDGRLGPGRPVRDAYELSLASLEFDALINVPIRIPFERRALLYAILSLRLREYVAYLENYATWPRGHRDSVPLLYAAARSALYLGLEARAIALASRGRTLAMSTDELSAFPIEVTSPLPSFWAIAVAASDEDSVDSFTSAKRRWGQELEKAIMPWLLAGMVSDNTMRRIYPDLSTNSKEVIDSLLGVEVPINGGKDLALMRRLGLALQEETNGYTGIIVADANYDGYVEESIEFLDGRPVSRRIDFDQDGQHEWLIDYKDGLPVRVSMDGGRLEVHYDENAYPEVSTMQSKQDNISGEAVFHPGAYRWDSAQGDVVSGQFEMFRTGDDNLWPFIGRISLRTEIPYVEEMGEIHTWLDEGVPIKIVEVRFSEEDEQNPLWIRELLFEEGVIVAGRRSLRSDAEKSTERLWELYERYEKGRLVGLAWDPQMRGTPLYLKDWALGVYMQIQAWDIDADGWMDVRQFLSAAEGKDARALSITEAEAADLFPWRTDSWYPWQ